MRRLLSVLATLAYIVAGGSAFAGTSGERVTLDVIGDQGTSYVQWVRMRPDAYPAPSGSILGWCGDNQECGKVFVKVNRDLFPRTLNSEDDFWLDRDTVYLYPVPEDAVPPSPPATMADVDAFYATLCADIARLEGRVVDVEVRVTTHDGQIADLLARVAALEDKDDEHDAQFLTYGDRVVEVLEKLEARISTGPSS